MLGRIRRALSPSSFLFCGGMRHPRTVRPRSFAVSTAIFFASVRCSTSRRGRNIIATPRSSGPFSKTIPFSCNQGSKILNGICVRTPAPSPVLRSASTAPRWVTRQTDCNPNWRMRLDFSPLKDAIKPTPQASRSNSGRCSEPGEVVGVPWLVIIKLKKNRG